MKQNYKAKPSELQPHVPGRAFAFFAANVRSASWRQMMELSKSGRSEIFTNKGHGEEQA